MVQRNSFRPGLSPKPRLFYPEQTPAIEFPVDYVKIDWRRLISSRSTILAKKNGVAPYLLKPEVVRLLDEEKNPARRLVMDLMWTTGARVSEVLSLTPASFVENGHEVGVLLRALKQKAGRPTKVRQRRFPKRFVPIFDPDLLDRVQAYLAGGHFRQSTRLFPFCRHTVNRHIDALVERVGGAPFSISAKTFRHSFAVHLTLYGQSQKKVSDMLGLRSTESTEKYAEVIATDSTHFLKSVSFH